MLPLQTMNQDLAVLHDQTLQVLELLIGMNADVSKANVENMTPLHPCCGCCSSETLLQPSPVCQTSKYHRLMAEGRAALEALTRQRHSAFAGNLQ